MMNLRLLDDWTFVRGAGSPAEKKACAMSAFSILDGEHFSDHSPCVSPIIRSVVIALNDAMPTGARQRFAMNIVCHIGNTAGDGNDYPRADILRRFVVRLASLVLRREGRQDLALSVESGDADAALSASDAVFSYNASYVCGMVANALLATYPSTCAMHASAIIHAVGNESAILISPDDAIKCIRDMVAVATPSEECCV